MNRDHAWHKRCNTRRQMITLAVSEIPCAHCGLRFQPRTRVERFCCAGCEVVNGLVLSKGLGEYYRIFSEAPPSCPVPAQTSSESYEFCDDAELIQRASSDGLHLRFFIEALNCTACLWLLEKLPDLCDDCESARVNMNASTIEVKRVSGGSFASIARALDRLGHRPHLINGEDTAERLRASERRSDLIRIAVSGAATGNIMLLAVALYAGADQEFSPLFRFLSAALALPVLTYGAFPFYRSALAALKIGSLNIDVPIVGAILAGIAMSAWALASGSDSVYFDSLSTLVFLLLSSRFLLKSVQEKYLGASHLEDEILAGTVTRISPTGQRERVSTLALVPGDLVEITGSMTIPTDATVIWGEGSFQKAALTGETDENVITPGCSVEAGSRNLTGTWMIRVRNRAADSRIATVLRAAERAAKEKPALIALTDRVSRWFVGAVLVSAAILALIFLKIDAQEGISRALALLIVTCPCVFGMAVPLSMSLGIRAAARRGIVIKNANALEKLTAIQTLCFDKTGTLTSGEMRVLQARYSEANSSELRAIRAIEENQTHPIALALSNWAKQNLARPEDISKATDIRVLSRGGIEGRIDGVTYSLRPMGLTEDTSGADIRSRYSLFRGEDEVATFDIGDQLRPDAQATLDWVRASGYEARLLSGDRPSTVAHCAAVLNLESKCVMASASPEEKAKFIKDLGGSVAMIGDGANDAAALASASVGIAVRGSMEASLRAADIFLMRQNLEAIPEIFKIARVTRNAIVRNLIFSTVFNLASGTLAAIGWMTPLWAAVLMPLSSLTVLTSALATGLSLIPTGAKEPNS